MITIARPIRKIIKGAPTMEGAGVRLLRAFGFHQVPDFDPFLLLDAFHSDNPHDYKRGFPWHPHRGIETITYVLDGDVEHQDSMGNGGVISSGDIQWMTAGGGILHQEMPKGDAKGRMRGFQLWANLPSMNKLMDPRYREVKSRDIPLIRTPNGAIIRVVAGKVSNVIGPVKEIVTNPEFLDISLASAKVFTHPIENGRASFAYVIEGQGYFDAARGSAQAADNLILYGPGDVVTVTTENTHLRFLLVSGNPIKEPVAWHGPIVMNTELELKQAFEEFEKGTFIKRR